MNNFLGGFVDVSDILPCGGRLLLRCGDRVRWAGSKDGGHWSCVLANMGTRDRSLVDQWESNWRHSGRKSCSSWYWKLWKSMKHWDCNGVIRNKPSPVQDFATIHSIYSISLVWERYVWGLNHPSQLAIAWESRACKYLATNIGYEASLPTVIRKVEIQPKF